MKKTFTVVELILSITIIGFLYTLFIPKNNSSKIDELTNRLLLQLKYLRYKSLIEFRYKQELERIYNKKIITAFTIKKFEDIEKHKLYKDVADIYLFDSKGYEKSLSFDHSLLKGIKFDKKVMLAGNIKYDDNLENLGEIADIVDISGGLETSEFKDFSKIEIFLNKIKALKNEN